MGSKRVDLEDVAAEFEMWRSSRDGRRIPQDLWSAAVGLLDRHSANAVCRRLRLNPQRFKEASMAGGAGRMAAGGGRRVGGGRGRGRRSASVTRSLPDVPGFVEMPPMIVAPAERAHLAAGYRLILESRGCTVTVVAAAAPDAAVVEAMCGMVVGLLGPRA